jgi:hypothetical protein
MKPSALRIERLLAKVEAARSARPRRYCFHPDEVAEAEAQYFALQISNVFGAANWNIGFCSSTTPGAITFGIAVPGSGPEVEAVDEVLWRGPSY